MNQSIVSQGIKKPSIWQFIKYTLISLLTTVVELSTFALFNYWIFTKYAEMDFHIWLLDYSVANGGLTAFLSFALSYSIAQVFNFFMQRKTTFNATNNLLASAILYATMILLIFFLQMWLPTLIRVPIARWIGNDWADLLIKNMMMTLSFLIQFPINKYVIMRKTQPLDNAVSKS